MFSVLLLGSPQLLLDGRPLDVTRRKSRALLYYLAARPAPVTRDHLLTLFWPDLDRSAAQQSLRTTLHGLRKSLGDGLVVSDDALALGPGVEVDARQLEAAVERAGSQQELSAALALYRGEFLADFSLPDNELFDDWTVVERERFRRLAVRGNAALAQQHEGRREFGAALDALQRALVLAPLQEDLQRAALRVQYLSGDRAGAIRRYEQLRQLLDEELGVPPMLETRELYDAIITDAVDEGAGAREDLRPAAVEAGFDLPGALPFVGRAAEIAALNRVLGSQKLALIEGEPGIGKTRLVEQWARSKHALTLGGGSYELERALPYQPIREALRGLLERPDWPTLRDRLDMLPIWRAQAARLLPELDAAQASSPALRSDYTTDESQLWEGVNQLLRGLARQRPVILFLDDLHWADESTLALLGYLVRQPAALPITFVGAAHSVAVRTPLAALVQTLGRADRLVRLQLGRLTPDDTVALARHLSPGYTYPLADWLADAAEGNPFVIAELVRYAREQSLLQANGALNLSALSAAPVVPRTVYSLIEGRLAGLSEQARQTLDVAVAIGREFTFDVLAHASGLGETDALNALDELRAAGLIVPQDGAGYIFDHSLTMEVAFREVGEPRHRLLHRRVAEAIEQVHRDNLDAVAGLLASHFAEGNAPERAAPYAFRAGQLAAGLAAWKEAISFFEQALTGSGEPQQGEILMALGDAQFHAGEMARSSETLRGAIRLAETRGDQAGAVAARLALPRSLLPQGRYAEIIELVRPLADDPASAAGAEFFWGAALSLEGADLAGAAEHLHRSEALLNAWPPLDALSLSRVKFELGGIAAQQGDLETAVRYYREVLDVALKSSADNARPWSTLALNNLAYHLLLLGDRQAGEYAREGMRLAQEKGELGAQPYLYSTLGEIALAGGDLSEAERAFNDGLALAERLVLPERVAGLTANLGLVAFQRGQSTLAIHRFSTALAQADALGTRHLSAQIRVWLAPLLPPEQAHATLAEARAIAEDGGRKRLLEAIDRLDQASDVAARADV